MQRRILASALLILFLAAPGAWGQTEVRVATYNIKFLSTEVTSQGDRLTKLKEVIGLLDADVIALQEVDNRAALRKIFSKRDWHIVIDDDSGDSQDIALAIRKPFGALGYDTELDADDHNFLFPGTENDIHFPKRRDLLVAQISLPDGDGSFYVLVHHAKSRYGGRAETDLRREGASRDIISILERDFDDRDFILLGDFNDNCDDRSLSILETGNPDALAGPEEIQGPFLVNLTEPLCAEGHVSHGLKSDAIVGDLVDTIDPESRRRNNEARGTNEHTGDIFFDQILIPSRMRGNYIEDTARVFNHAVAVRGNDSNRASDHVPVFADFVLGETAPGTGTTEPTAEGVRIAALLPNPDGEDRGNEQTRLHNGTGSNVSLDGWRLRDRAGNVYALSGSVPANDTLTITMTSFSMPLNNSGDDVSLIDNQGNIRHHVSYSSSQASPGSWISFE